jgi:hypothetical protein
MMFTAENIRQKLPCRYKKIIRRLPVLIIIAVLILTFSSCYKRVEGCLDSVSSNYNPLADDACSGCCKNPNLTISIKHQINDTFYSPLDTVYNMKNQMYKILDFSYYISDVKVRFQSGDYLTGIKNVEYTTSAGNFSIEDNFIKIRPDVFVYTVNEIRNYGIFDSLFFVAGLDEGIRSASSINVANSHVLSDSLFLKDENKQKIWWYVTIAKGKDFSDTLQLSFDLNEKEVDMVFAKNLDTKPGNNVPFTIKINYDAWFEETDFEANLSEIKNSVLKNLKKGFIVE